MIATILSELESLDYVFLVVKSDTQRVNYAIKNVYDKIQNLYAKDLVPRLCGIFTFSSDKSAPAVVALKQIGIDIEPDKQFSFNNDALYYRFESFKTEEEQLKATYWKNRIANFDNLREFMHK